MRLNTLLASALLALCSSGCLVSHSSNASRSGHFVSHTTLTQMQPGETTAEWARAVVGEPTSIQSLTDGREIWKWSYSERKTSHGAVFLLFQSNDVQQEEGTVFAEFKDGILVRWWQG